MVFSAFKGNTERGGSEFSQVHLSDGHASPKDDTHGVEPKLHVNVVQAALRNGSSEERKQIQHVPEGRRPLSAGYTGAHRPIGMMVMASDTPMARAGPNAMIHRRINREEGNERVKSRAEEASPIRSGAKLPTAQPTAAILVRDGEETSTEKITLPLERIESDAVTHTEPSVPSTTRDIVLQTYRSEASSIDVAKNPAKPQPSIVKANKVVPIDQPSTALMKTANSQPQSIVAKEGAKSPLARLQRAARIVQTTGQMMTPRTVLSRVKEKDLSRRQEMERKLHKYLKVSCADLSKLHSYVGQGRAFFVLSEDNRFRRGVCKV